MKNKRVKVNLKTDSKISAPLKNSSNIKNREQLRRKLKDLLEKDKTLAYNVKNSKVVSGVIKNPKKTSNMTNTQFTEKSIVKDKKCGKKEPKREVSKRIPIEKQKPSAGKNYSVGKSSSKNSSLEVPAKKSKSNNFPQECNGTRKMAKKCDFAKKVQKKATLVQPEVKVNKKSPDSLHKQKPSTIKSSFFAKKTKKQNKDNGYRGPLRPISPASEVDYQEGEWHSDTQSEGNNNLLSVHLPQEDDFESQSDDTWNTIDCDMESESELSSGTAMDDEDFSSSGFDYSSTDSQYDFESDSEGENFQDFSDGYSDSTYQLPDNVPEDIYVAKGAAVKHDLSESNEIGFDSDDSCPQIIEIENKDNPQQIRNALAWNVEATNTAESAEKTDDSCDSCPELVPIVNGSVLETDYDSDSCSDCIADKYFEHDAHEGRSKKLRMVPEIFKADRSETADVDSNLPNTSDPVSEHEVEGSPLERIANANGSVANFKVVTVANKKQPNFDDERKENEKKNSKKVDTLKESFDNNKFDNTKKQERINQLNSFSAKENLAEKSHQSLPEDTSFNMDLDCSIKDNDARNKCNQLNGDTASPQEYSTTRGDSVKNKSQLKTLFFNAINSNQVIVLLKDPLYLYGTLKLKLLAGGLDIFGYNPKPNELLEVFSPRGYGSLKIEPSTKYATTPVFENELNELASTFLKSDIESVRKNYNCKQDAILILERNDDSKKVNMLRKYMMEDLFPNMNLLQSDRPFYTSEFLLRCVLTPTAEKPLIINPKWRSISVTNTSRVMIIGGKSVGKSSLVRFLSNNYLNNGSKVLLIDLDIGQPEMFVPQTVSATTLTAPLLGPGYLSVKEPDKAYLVGHINVVLQPQLYIQSVHALISFCKENLDYKNIPWIVNTMGYNKGFGDEIIAAICRFLNPTNIVQLESRNEINNFDLIMSRANLQAMQFDIIGDMVSPTTDYHPDHLLTIMSSVASSNKKYQNDWELKPRDIRLAMIISRLSVILKGQAEWFTDVKPVCASADDLKLVTLGDDILCTDDLLRGLTGNLVYLCKHNSNSLNECLGIGIVRGIDLPLKQIYLLPAIPIKLLEDVNCLAICGIPLPSSILINQGPKVKDVVSYIYNTIDRSASMHIKQMYNRPQHFLTGKFKPVTDP